MLINYSHLPKIEFIDNKIVWVSVIDYICENIMFIRIIKKIVLKSMLMKTLKYNSL